MSHSTLTLCTDAKGLETLRTSSLVKNHAVNGGGQGRFERVVFERIYYDTSDRRLGRRHVTLCVDIKERISRQILEIGADRAPGVERSGIWEGELRGNAPDLRAIPSLEARERVGMILPGEFEPVFTLRGSRCRRTLSLSQDDGDGLRVTFVEGEQTSSGRTEPIARLELEPSSQSPAAHLNLAGQLHELVPLRWQTGSDAARCLFATSDVPPPWAKARQPELPGGISVSDALAAIVQSCVAQWRHNEAAAVDGRDPEGVHQLRVAVRRLHSALSVFGVAIPEIQRLELRGETKWLLTSMGTARDLDVFLGELVAPIAAVREDDPHLKELVRVAEAWRQSGYEEVRAAVDSPRYTKLLLRVAAWAAGRGWQEGGDPELLSQPMVALSDRLLHKRQRQAKKRGRGFAKLSTADRHRVRIALKRLRYASEFFSSLYPDQSVAPYLSKLKQMQNSLGTLNDVAVAEARLDELVARASDEEQKKAMHIASGLVLGWHSRGLASLEPKMVAAWHAFKEQAGPSEKPGGCD